MCRIAVSELNEKRSWFEEKGVSLIAIGFQTDVYSQRLFAESGCWDPEHLYVDGTSSVYDFVEIHKFPGPSVFFSFQSPMKMLKILQYGQANNDLVVGYRLGGGFLADKNGNVVFRYLQEKYGQHASLEEIQGMVKALFSDNPPKPLPAVEPSPIPKHEQVTVHPLS